MLRRIIIALMLTTLWDTAAHADLAADRKILRNEYLRTHTAEENDAFIDSTNAEKLATITAYATALKDARTAGDRFPGESQCARISALVTAINNVAP